MRVNSSTGHSPNRQYLMQVWDGNKNKHCIILISFTVSRILFD